MFPMKWWVKFELRKRSSGTHFNDLFYSEWHDLVKRKYLLLPRAKEATKKRNLKDIHVLGPYFTWFTLNEKFIAY